MPSCGRASGSDNRDVVAALNDILTALQASAEQAQLLIMCALPSTTPPTKIIVEAVYDATANTWAYTLPGGASVQMGVDFESCMDGATPPEVEAGACRIATVGGAGYAAGDLLQEYLFWDGSVVPADLVSSQWRNVTQQTVMAAAPSMGDTEPCDKQLDISALATVANQTIANSILSGIQTDQTVGNTALASILAAMADDATAANQATIDVSIQAVRTAIAQQYPGDIELVCADNAPAFRTIDGTGTVSFFNGSGVFTPTTWTPGACAAAPLDISALATVANQTIANSILSGIQTDQTVGNTALASILAAMADDATAANQTTIDVSIQAVRTAIAQQYPGDIELVCADNAPAFRTVDGTGTVSFFNGSGVFTPTTWTPGACPAAEVARTWTTTEVVAADGVVAQDSAATGPYYGYTAVLVIDDPLSIDYAADYGEHDGIRVPVMYSFGQEAISGERLEGAHTLRAFGNARWIVKLKN